MFQFGPATRWDERAAAPLSACVAREQLARQRHPEPGAGRILQQAGIGEVEPLGLQVQIVAALEGPVVPVHLPLPVQGGALLRGLCQHGRARHRQQPIRQQRLMAAFRLGSQPQRSEMSMVCSAMFGVSSLVNSQRSMPGC